MKEFPDKLNPNNLNNFKDILYERNLCYLRKDIYEHLLRKTDNNDYYNIDKFNIEYVNDKCLIEDMIKTVIKELTNMGWTCLLVYGETGLFVYTEENKPIIYGCEF